MISRAERSNYLRQCWRRRRWKDGVGTLLLPLRMSLYGFRKQALGRRGRGAASVAEAPEVAPAFSTDIVPIFCRSSAAALTREGLEFQELFTEVDRQLQGEYRLAGGRTLRLDIGNLEALSDPEDHHSYHRLYWAVRYAVAAALGHHSAAGALVRELSRWIETRWDGSAVAIWPYTVAERIASLVTILFWIDHSSDGQLTALVVPIKRQIWNDAHRLSSTIEYGLGVHNHLLNDARGLFLAGAALRDCAQADGWKARAFEIFDEYFPKLVLEDGTFAEQSSHYHLLLCRTGLEYALACRWAGRSLPSGFEARLQAMFRLANELLRADGSIPRFGDNSPDRTGQDLWGVLAAAHFYGLLTELPRHRAVTPLTIFYCGAPFSFVANNSLEADRGSALGASSDLGRVPQAVSPCLFPKGGFVIVRSGALNAELVAHGDVGETMAPHGDAGRGSYELWWNGNVLIREPGCFHSNSDPASRFYQSPEAQNVTSLNGLSPVIDKQDARFLGRWYWPKGGEWRALPGEGAEFRCEAFGRLDPSIVLFRTWRFDQANSLTFEERIEGSSRIRFASRICLGDAGWTQATDAAAPGLCHLLWHDADGSTALMTVTAPDGITFEIRSCHFLPDYGVEKPGRVLQMKGSQKLPFSWTIRWQFSPAVKSVRELGTELMAQVKAN